MCANYHKLYTLAQIRHAKINCNALLSMHVDLHRLKYPISIYLMFSDFSWKKAVWNFRIFFKLKHNFEQIRPHKLSLHFMPIAIYSFHIHIPQLWLFLYVPNAISPLCLQLILIARNPDFVASEQQRHRPDCASAQSGQRLCYSLYRKDNSLSSYIQHSFILANLCSLTGWIGHYQVENRENGFSHD